MQLNERYLSPEYNPRRFLCKRLNCVLSIDNCIMRVLGLALENFKIQDIRAAHEFCRECVEGRNRVENEIKIHSNIANDCIKQSEAIKNVADYHLKMVQFLEEKIKEVK